MTQSLFQDNMHANQPLAERARPNALDGFVGQDKLVGKDGPIRKFIESDRLVSMIFWGPPGCGKTTLAHIIAETTQAKFVTLSAVSSGVKELRVVMEQAKNDLELHRTKTILFIDEIHRWNKSQQDALLPHMERGLVTLIGATTENPSFELNNALLSRTQVFVFEQLSPEELESIVRAVETRHGVSMREDVVSRIISVADGDARVALNTVEMLQQIHDDLSNVTIDDVKGVLEKVALRYDKHGEEHHNLISALHKTMRASDVNAAMYWAGRMLFSGEDPMYLMRRIVEFASADIGNADPNALQVAVAAFQATHLMGMPECRKTVMQAVAYCATAPKSQAIYHATNMIEQDIQNTPASPVPMHLRNAPTQRMSASGGKDVGYGLDVGESNLPEQLKDREYYPS